MIALERNYLNLRYIESESRIFDGRHLRTVCFFLYAIKCKLIFGVKLPIRYPFHEIWVSLRLNLRWILYESSNFFLFNIEGYMENSLVVLLLLDKKTRNLILMVPCSNWLWTVTTDPVWHFPHQNVTKYIKVSCCSFNMNIMQYFGKYSPCTRCTCTEGIEI